VVLGGSGLLGVGLSSLFPQEAKVRTAVATKNMTLFIVGIFYNSFSFDMFPVP